MKAFIATIRQIARDEGGLTAIEYGLMAATLAVAAAGGAALVKDGLNTVFTNIKNALIA